ncbi:hypothetical protein Hypma_000564 [Hypsizygus marmoreus]|uniref:Uncharacterized protein n=1 Tax=Hypsizygus marmoreus TaxID=39966 RepID=A0A369JFH1_HYPMA|nr:hypothetical protein Hypma_000564 [Hypsizygus marmoreus]
MDGPSTFQACPTFNARPTRPLRRRRRRRHAGHPLHIKPRSPLEGVPSEFYSHPLHIAHKTDAPSYVSRRGYEDPLATMMLIQMLADAYTDSRMEWETNKDRVPQEGDDLAMYGPNAAQRKIERYLVATRFLPRLAPETVVIKRVRRRSEVVHVAQQSRWSRCLQFVTRSRYHNARSPIVDSKPGIRTKIADIIRKCLSIKKPKPVREANPPPIILPARLALPRIIPSTKPLLRRMTSADTRALLAASVRKNRVPRIRKVVYDPEPVINLIIAPELRVKLGDIDWEDFKTLRWSDRSLQLAVKPMSTSIPLVYEKENRDASTQTERRTERPPLYITLSLIFLFQFTMFSIMLFMILWGIWHLISVFIGLFFSSSAEDE